MADLTVSSIVDAFMQSTTAFNCTAPVVVNAASGFAGNLIDAQLAGTSKFKVEAPSGNITWGNGYAFINNGSNSSIFAVAGYNILTLVAGGNSKFIGGLTIGNQFADDCTIARIGANNLRLGKDANPTPLAQTLTIGESSRPGTDSNVAGANGTIQSGLGTGTGAGSSLIFQTPTVVGAGSGVQTYATRMTLNATTGLTLAGPTNLNVGTYPNSVIIWYDGTIGMGQARNFSWATRASMDSPSDGVIRVSNNAQTDFNRLQLGGTTASFPAIKRVGSGIHFRTADDTNFCQTTMGTLIVTSWLQASELYITSATTISTGAGTPEGAKIANPGSLFLRTDGGVNTLYVKQSGTGNTGWVVMGAGGVGLDDFPTWTGMHTFKGTTTFSPDGAMLTPKVSIAGTKYTGIYAVPELLIGEESMEPPAWSSAGTLLGMDQPAGYVGNLIDCFIGGVRKFRVAYTGVVAADAREGEPFEPEGIGVAAGGGFWWSGLGGFLAEVDGTIMMLNSTGIGFNRLQFGGSDATFPALKRNAAGLDVRLADDTAGSSLTVADEAYGPTWATSLQVPTKNALFTKIETLGGGGGTPTTYLEGHFPFADAGGALATPATPYMKAVGGNRFAFASTDPAGTTFFDLSPDAPVDSVDATVGAVAIRAGKATGVGWAGGIAFNVSAQVAGTVSGSAPQAEVQALKLADKVTVGLPMILGASYMGDNPSIQIYAAGKSGAPPVLMMAGDAAVPWNPEGTYLGINTGPFYQGCVFDFKKAGSSQLKLDGSYFVASIATRFTQTMMLTPPGDPGPWVQLYVTPQGTMTLNIPGGSLDIQSPNGGILIPRLTRVQRDAIVTPLDGLTIFQTDIAPGLRVFQAGAWVIPTVTADP